MVSVPVANLGGDGVFAGDPQFEIEVFLGVGTLLFWNQDKVVGVFRAVGVGQEFDVEFVQGVFFLMAKGRGKSAFPSRNSSRLAGLCENCWRWMVLVFSLRLIPHMPSK